MYASVSKTERGKSKCQGVVQFDTPEDAKSAIAAFAGSDLGGGSGVATATTGCPAA